VLKKIDLYVYILRLFSTKKTICIVGFFVIAISRECRLFDLDIRQEIDTFMLRNCMWDLQYCKLSLFFYVLFECIIDNVIIRSMKLQ